jgi:Kef-type K+ transport system membrane component KefB
MSTTVGFITVCAAAAGDIVAWILLALLVSLINATTPIMPLYVVLMAIGWCLILAYAVRPMLLTLVRVTHSVRCCIISGYFFCLHNAVVAYLLCFVAVVNGRSIVPP